MIHQTKIIPRYAETDQMGIVHHSVYPIWYEAARTEFSKAAGFSYKKMEETGVMTPIIELNSKYIRPAFYDEEVILETRLSKLTPVKAIFSYEVFDKTSDKPINKGYTVHALVGKDLKPINTKKQFPEIYQILQNCLEEQKED